METHIHKLTVQYEPSHTNKDTSFRHKHSKLHYPFTICALYYKEYDVYLLKRGGRLQKLHHLKTMNRNQSHTLNGHPKHLLTIGY